MLLVLDGHSTHTQSIEALQKATDAGVIMLSIPSHCSHVMQPLDVSFFKPLSSYYNQAAGKWLQTNAGRPLTMYELSAVFGEADAKAASIATAMAG